MASKLRGSTRGKRKGGSGGSRRGGKASAKRQASARRANKRQAGNRTSGTSTGRESGIAAANTYNRDKKEKSLQQSVGSLDRRVEKALADGNTALAKDLRSRQKNFVKDLAYERARKTPGGIMQGNVRTSDGRRPLTSAGFDVFQETIDQDFIDPTRKLQNRRDGNYKTMYPISAGIQKGLPSAQILKKFFGQEEKDIPYNLDDMPGVRYPLDTGFGAGEGEPFFGGRSRDPDFDSYPYIAPVEPVTISDLEDDKSVPFTNNVVPYQFPIIDPSQRTEESNKMSDIIDSGVQDFATLDEEFQKKGGETKYLPNLSDLVDLGANLTGANYVADGLTAVADKAYGYIPVEDFMEETNIKLEQGKSNLKEQYPYLNDAQIDNLYNYNMTGSLSDSLDSDPVVFDDYMTKRLF